jgi:PAS domain S-box-containing protein
MEKTVKKILIVEDETSHYELIQRSFERRVNEFSLKRAANLSQANELLVSFQPDLIISDWKLPDGNGTSLIQKDKKDHLKTPIILMTSFGNEAFVVEAMKLGALDYVVKSPEVFADMPHLVDRILREWKNIRDRIRVEDQLKRLSIAVEQSSVIVVFTDIEGIIEYVNPSFEKVTGYRTSYAIGKTPSFLKSGHTSESEYKTLWGTIRSGQEWRSEFVNKKADGSLYWEAVYISPVFNDNGSITNYLKIGEDITDKKRMEIDLKAALGKAEESNRLKTSILANMNHELRTPLMGILGMSQLLAEELTENAEHQKMVERILHSGTRLMNTLNSILDLSEIESDSSLLKFSEYPVAESLEYILVQHSKTASEKNLSFEILNKDSGLYVFVYEKFLNQAISNIVDNAIKYTHHGGITITVENALNNEKLWAKISISDTGIGIAKHHLDLIFQEFRQASEGFSRNYEGSGLGLSIAKKMVEIMYGILTVESVLGKGTTFTIWFPATKIGEEFEQVLQPLSKTIEPIEIPEKIEFSRSIHVLYVEDNLINQEVTKLFLQKIARVDCARDGRTAIEMAKRSPYSLILMDINLSTSLDGIEVTKYIRAVPGYKSTPIIATTGYASRADKEKFLASGLNDILVKPYTKPELISLIHKYLG